MDKSLLNVLVCPICKGALIYDKVRQELICEVDKLAFAIKDETPNMLANEARIIS